MNNNELNDRLNKHLGIKSRLKSCGYGYTYDLGEERLDDHWYPAENIQDAIRACEMTGAVWMLSHHGCRSYSAIVQGMRYSRKERGETPAESLSLALLAYLDAKGEA
jgi:hypothetical protein